MKRQGMVVVLSGPSGSGKTTVARKLCELEPQLHRAVSATTRPPRPSEVDGKDYYFLSEETFAQKVAAGAFIEHASYGGYRYGTLQSEIEKAWEQHKDVLLEIDVQGAAQVLKHYAEAVTIWIVPPSWEALETRLRQRHTESEAKIQARLQRARDEFRSIDLYRYAVINRDNALEQAVAQVRCILVAERCRLDSGRCEQILREFGGYHHA